MTEQLGLDLIERKFREAFFSRANAAPITAQEALEAWGADPAKLESGQAFVGLGIMGRGLPLPVHILTKELDMGNPGMKWFRRITMVGKGICFIRVTVDGMEKIFSRISLEHFAGGTKWLAFPRGTAGRRMRLEVWGDIAQIQAPVVDWDIIGVPAPASGPGQDAQEQED